MFPLFWLCPRCCRVDFECKHTQHSRTFSFSRVLRGSCPMDNPMRSNSLWGKMGKVFGQIKLLGDDLGIFWYTPQISVHKKNVSNFDLLTYPHLSPSFPIFPTWWGRPQCLRGACLVPGTRPGWGGWGRGCAELQRGSVAQLDAVGVARMEPTWNCWMLWKSMALWNENE